MLQVCATTSDDNTWRASGPRVSNPGQASGESDGLTKFTRNARKPVHTDFLSATAHRIKARCTYATSQVLIHSVVALPSSMPTFLTSSIRRHHVSKLWFPVLLVLLVSLVVSPPQLILTELEKKRLLRVVR